MMFRPQSLVSLLLCAVCFARSAQADPSASEISAAKHAFEAAVVLENERHWAEAELKLRAAVAVKDTPGLRFHLAHCETEQGHFVEALQDYERANAQLRSGAQAPDVQKLLGPASDALKTRIARIVVQLPADLNSPAVSLDDKVYPSSALQLGVPVNPGRHELRIAAQGRRTFERALALKEGEQVSLHPDLAPSAAPVHVPAIAPVPAPAPVPAIAPAPAPASSPPNAPPRPVPEATSSTSRSSSAKAYLLVGESALTVAGLAVGIAYRASASAASRRVDSAQTRIDAAAPNDVGTCGTTTQADVLRACSDLHTSIQDHDRAIIVSSVGFVSAGVGAAALLTTWLVYPGSKSQTSGLRVQPMAGFGRLGVLGTF